MGVSQLVQLLEKEGASSSLLGVGAMPLARAGLVPNSSSESLQSLYTTSGYPQSPATSHQTTSSHAAPPRHPLCARARVAAWAS